MSIETPRPRARCDNCGATEYAVLNAGKPALPDKWGRVTASPTNYGVSNYPNNIAMELCPACLVMVHTHILAALARRRDEPSP